MDGSRTTSTAQAAVPTRGAAGSSRLPRSRSEARWVIGHARRREQLRLLVDPVTRAAAAQVVALQDDSRDAFDTLYLRYAPYVAAIGSRLLGRDDELDDLVQDVFVQVLRGLGQLREPAAFKGWLAQITIRGATRRLRKRSLRRELARPDAYAPHEQLCMQAASPEQGMLSRQVYKQLDVLPAKSRVIWILRHVEGEPLHVIAQRTSCSLSTVQRRLIDAQAVLEDRFLQELAV